MVVGVHAPGRNVPVLDGSHEYSQGRRRRRQDDLERYRDLVLAKSTANHQGNHQAQRAASRHRIRGGRQERAVHAAKCFTWSAGFHSTCKPLFWRSQARPRLFNPRMPQSFSIHLVFGRDKNPPGTGVAGGHRFTFEPRRNTRRRGPSPFHRTIALLVVGCSDSSVRIWDLALGKEIRSTEGASRSNRRSFSRATANPSLLPAAIIPRGSGTSLAANRFASSTSILSQCNVPSCRATMNG